MENKLKRIIREELQRAQLNESVSVNLGDARNTMLISSPTGDGFYLRQGKNKVYIDTNDVSLFLNVLNRVK